MKNKKKIIIAAASFLVLLLAAALVWVFVGQNNKSGSDHFAGAPRMRQPDFGQPDRVPDIRGVVKSIVGNEITILKIDMPNRDGNSSSTPSKAAQTEKTTVNLAGGNRVPGGMGGGMGRPGEQNENTRAEMLAKMKEMSTGEEQVIIPVGIQMLKFDTTSGKREPVEASLADITADKSITIWTSSTSTDASASSTKKMAEFVLIN